MGMESADGTSVEIDLTAENDLDNLAASPHASSITSLTILTRAYDTNIFEPMEENTKYSLTTHNDIIFYAPSAASDDFRSKRWHNMLDSIRCSMKRQDEAVDLQLAVALGECFGQLSSLKALETSVKVIHRRVALDPNPYLGGWDVARSRVSKEFGIIMSAIVEGAIQLEVLNLLGNVPQCAVPIHSIQDFHESLQARGLLAKNLESITSLALSVAIADDQSMPSWKVLSDDGHVARAGAVAELVKMMPRLECLDLQFYMALPKTNIDLDNSDLYSRKNLMQACLEPVLRQVHLPCLRRCVLRGMTATPGDLTHFITKHNSLTHLALEGIHLQDTNDGSWSALMPRLIDTLSPSLQDLKLANLTGRHGLMDLRPTGLDIFADLGDEERHRRFSNWTMPFSRGDCLYHTLHLGPRELEHRPLELAGYRPGAWPLVSQRQQKWRQKRDMEFLPSMG